MKKVVIIILALIQADIITAQFGYAMKFIPGDRCHVWSIDNESMTDVTNNF